MRSTSSASGRGAGSRPPTPKLEERPLDLDPEPRREPRGVAELGVRVERQVVGGERQSASNSACSRPRWRASTTSGSLRHQMPVVDEQELGSRRCGARERARARTTPRRRASSPRARRGPALRRARTRGRSPTSSSFVGKGEDLVAAGHRRILGCRRWVSASGRCARTSTTPSTPRPSRSTPATWRRTAASRVSTLGSSRSGTTRTSSHRGSRPPTSSSTWSRTTRAAAWGSCGGRSRRARSACAAPTSTRSRSTRQSADVASAARRCSRSRTRCASTGSPGSS